jgi:hypothetical protein
MSDTKPVPAVPDTTPAAKPVKAARPPKAPVTHSAATTAAVISRRLRAAGFTMADTSDRFRWTEGVTVRRVGYSSLVSVDYYRRGTDRTPESLARARGVVDRLKLWLKDNLYPIDEDAGSGLYVRCKTE